MKVDVGKKKKEVRTFLGSLTPHNIIDEEDSDIQSTVVWRDPFRMSVLDFQRSALDKVAEVLKILIKYASGQDPLKGKLLLQKEDKKASTKAPMEDVHFHLHHIKHYKEDYASLLRNLGGAEKLSPTDAIDMKCDMLITARNHIAHQAYIKDDITPPHNPSKPSKNRLGSGHVPLKETKTFKHTKSVIMTCLEFAEKVLEGMTEAKQIVSIRQLLAIRRKRIVVVIIHISDILLLTLPELLLNLATMHADKKDTVNTILILIAILA